MLVVLLLALGAVVVWGALEVRTVTAHAPQVQDAVRDLTEAARAQEWAAADEASAHLSDASQEVRDAAWSPPLRAAAALPVVGTDVQAIQAVADVTDLVADEAVAPMVDVARELLSGGPGLSVDLASLRAAAPVAVDADRAVAEALSRLDEVDPASLHGPVRGEVASATEQLREVAPTLSSAADAAQHLPGMLGADEPRSYLLAFQNPAEARPTGGIFGSWAEVRLTGGDLEMVGTGVNDDLGQMSVDQLTVDDEALALWGPDLALSQNFNLSPHFPRAAALLSDLWVATDRPAPSGVVAVDPVLLQEVLRATGPLDVEGGPTLTGENTADWLMNGVYEALGGNTDERNAYLTAVTAAVFERLTGDAGFGALWDVLVASGGGEHVLLWSAVPQEQEFLQRAGVSGALPEPDRRTVGVFTTNADGSKLDHSLARSVEVEGDCTGTPPRIRLTLANEAPEAVHPYVANQLPEEEPTTHRVVVSFYLPPTRGVRTLQVDGSARHFAAGTELGWTVVRTTVDVAREDAAVLELQLDSDWSPVRDVLTQPGHLPSDVSVSACTQS